VRRPSPTSAKRWTLKLALCLLAGAVVTWGVAWGCALSPRGPVVRRTIQGPSALTEAAAMGVPLHHWYQSGTLHVEQHFDFGFEVLVLDLTRKSFTSDDTHHLPTEYIVSSDTWAGWPGRALWCGGRGSFPLEGALELPPILAQRLNVRKLPARILPLGFALNTLFYAAVVLGMVECVAFARRRVRRSKGRCPSCGYDRAGLANGAACPECGT
jgi:hypothetical protein